MNTSKYFTQTTLVLYSLLMSFFVGWGASVHPKILLATLGLALSVFLITQVRDLWLILFVIGIHFDDIFLPLGFAKVGFGDLALALLLGYWFLWRYQQKNELQLADRWYLLVIYLIGVGLSWLQGPNPDFVKGSFVRLILYVVGYFALVDILRNKRQLSTFIGTMIFVISIHVIIAFQLDSAEGRLLGLVGQPNYFAGLIGPGAITTLICAFSPVFKIKTRFFFLCLTLLITYGLILTVSRGAQVAFLLALVWTFRNRWRTIVIGLAMILTIIQLIFIIDPERLAYFFNRWELSDGSVTDRQSIIFNALNAITEHPFFGVGFSQFVLLEDLMNIDVGQGRSSHNYYIGQAATIGIPSTLTVFGFILYQARKLWQLNFPHQPRLQLQILILQGIFIFQSTALIFRGGRRMIEWSLLALYTAAVILYYKPNYQSSVQSNPSQ